MGKRQPLVGRLIDMKPPNGFVTLCEAVGVAGRAMLGTSWYHPPCRDDHERITKLIAEGCEARRLAAAYRNHRGGANPLDPAVWQSPSWRNYFDTGTIDLDLPLLDGRGRPNRDGLTARCTREIFVRRES